MAHVRIGNKKPINLDSDSENQLIYVHFDSPYVKAIIVTRDKPVLGVSEGRSQVEATRLSHIIYIKWLFVQRAWLINSSVYLKWGWPCSNKPADKCPILSDKNWLTMTGISGGLPEYIKQFQNLQQTFETSFHICVLGESRVRKWRDQQKTSISFHCAACWTEIPRICHNDSCVLEEIDILEDDKSIFIWFVSISLEAPSSYFYWALKASLGFHTTTFGVEHHKPVPRWSAWQTSVNKIHEIHQNNCHQLPRSCHWLTEVHQKFPPKHSTYFPNQKATLQKTSAYHRMSARLPKISFRPHPPSLSLGSVLQHLLTNQPWIHVAWNRGNPPVGWSVGRWRTTIKV